MSSSFNAGNHASRSWARRWMVVGAVGVLSCSGGGSDATAPSTPSGSTPPPVTPVAPTNPNAAFLGGWTGTTSQGKQLAFHVADSGVVIMMAGWTVTGTGCSDNIVSFIAREPPNAPFAITNGSFTAIQTSTTLGTLTLTGTLSATGSASGTIVMNDTRCPGTLNGTWTATKATSADVNLTGSWNGTFASSLVSKTNGSFVLSQSDKAVSGTYVVVTGAMGTLTGSVSGRTVTFAMAQTTSGCTGAFAGHGVVMQSPEMLVYYYSGTDCLGAHTGGNGSATRQ